MGRKPILTDKEVHEAYKLYQDGATYDMLAFRYQVNWYTIRYSFARLGLQGRTSKETKALGNMTLEEVNKAHKLQMEGYTLKAIGRELGLGVDRIRGGLQAAGYNTSRIRTRRGKIE
ncbi:MAG: hypothetical protein K0M69_15865 [Youngiibacter sp.]|nr:hypothetical protein [Youngiibacter sp.]